MMRIKIPVLAIACLFGCLMAGAQETPTTKPDFSGTWVLNPERSSLHFQVPGTLTFVIEHREPHWRLQRKYVHDGKSDFLEMELTTDGEPTTLTLGGTEVHARLHWDGETLVYESKSNRQGQPQNVVTRYSLKEGGRIFLAEEHLQRGQDAHDNVWVCERSDEP